MAMAKKGGFMKDLIIEQIERRARLDHGGDVNKAATEYFRDYPEEWQRYKEEVTGVNKRAGKNRERVNAEVHSRIEDGRLPREIGSRQASRSGGGSAKSLRRGSRFV